MCKVEASGQTMATLSFSPLTFSDAGIYTCQATVTSSLLSAPISQLNSSNAVIINPMCKIFAYTDVKPGNKIKC